MLKAEAEIITQDLIDCCPHCYNLVTGGQGGRVKWSNKKRKHLSKVLKLNWKNMSKEEYENRCKILKETRNQLEVKQRMSKGIKLHYSNMTKNEHIKFNKRRKEMMNR